MESEALNRLVFDAGPFILLFTNEKGTDLARKAVTLHERREIEIFIHPNNLAESYKVISGLKEERKRKLATPVEPETVIRSAYASLHVLCDEETTLQLGKLRSKYLDKPWGDLSSAALALRLSKAEKVPIVVLDHEEHFEDIREVETIRISNPQLE